jgi:hypothetical protein
METKLDHWHVTAVSQFTPFRYTQQKRLPRRIAMGCQPFVVQERTEKLANALFSLDEPWRSRFLHLVANQATGWTWPEQMPTQAEVAAWLNDWELYKRVKSQLNVWQGKQL